MPAIAVTVDIAAVVADYTEAAELERQVRTVIGALAGVLNVQTADQRLIDSPAWFSVSIASRH